MSGISDVTREEAQARVNRINAFRAELEELERRGAITLTDQQRAQLHDYHHTLLDALTQRFEVDRSRAESQLSLGLRVVSLLGAAACTAAVFLFFQRFWGLLSSPVQVTLVWLAPLAALAGALATARVERTLYFTALLSILAFGCFVMNVYVVGTILNARPSPQPFLVWSAFALAVAYAWIFDSCWPRAPSAQSLSSRPRSSPGTGCPSRWCSNGLNPCCCRRRWSPPSRKQM